MTKHWTPLAFVYLGLALIGLVGTAIANGLTVVQGRDFIGDLAAGGAAVSSISIDLGVAAVAGVILLLVEGRRLRMRVLWLYVVLSLVVAFSFAFPLFLANRERTLTRRAAKSRPAA